MPGLQGSVKRTGSCCGLDLGSDGDNPQSFVASSKNQPYP